MPDDPARGALRRKQTAYAHALGGDAGKEVLADLRIFCAATKSVFSSDPLQMARMAGRQEVIQRIMTFLKVDFADYYNYEERDIHD